jgi:hypothetical protein
MVNLMSDPYGPVHRALLDLAGAGPHLTALAHALDVLMRQPATDALGELRKEARAQVKRLQGLLELVVAAEVGHLQRAPEVD